MKDKIKKAFLLGLGAASITKAEAEKRIKVLVKKSPLTAKDGKEMLKKVISHANKESKKLKQLGKTEAKKIKARIEKSSQPQIKNLKKKISNLEKRLSKEGKRTAKKALKKAYRRL